jgi:hypothetical protein
MKLVIKVFGRQSATGDKREGAYPTTNEASTKKVVLPREELPEHPKSGVRVVKI